MKRLVFSMALIAMLGLFAVTLSGCYTFGADPDYDRMHGSIVRYDTIGALEDWRMVCLLDRPSRLTDRQGGHAMAIRCRVRRSVSGKRTVGLLRPNEIRQAPIDIVGILAALMRMPRTHQRQQR